jgi:integrase
MLNYRDYDGVTRPVERYGATGAKAERRLLEALKVRAKAANDGEITRETRVSEACRIWFDEFKKQGKATATINSYDDALRLHIIPSVGGLRIWELTVGVADRFLSAVRDNAGPSAAKHAKTVLSGVLGLATRREAIDHNPMRDVSPIAIDTKEARSLTLDEVRTLRAGLLGNERAVDRGVPAIVDFMLGTGMRIGETLALGWNAVDLDAATVEIRATLVYDRQQRCWVIQPKPKTAKGWRKVHVPPWLATLLTAHEVIENPWNVVFPSQRGKLRDRSNTNADIRAALDPLGFAWITTHTFRKTAATLLNDGGLTVREIADQLGHKRVSVTQDTYFGRAAPSAKVAQLLQVIHEDAP